METLLSSLWHMGFRDSQCQMFSGYVAYKWMLPFSFCSKPFNGFSSSCDKNFYFIGLLTKDLT